MYEKKNNTIQNKPQCEIENDEEASTWAGCTQYNIMW